MDSGVPTCCTVDDPLPDTTEVSHQLLEKLLPATDDAKLTAWLNVLLYEEFRTVGDLRALTPDAWNSIALPLAVKARLQGACTADAVHAEHKAAEAKRVAEEAAAAAAEAKRVAEEAAAAAAEAKRVAEEAAAAVRQVEARLREVEARLREVEAKVSVVSTRKETKVEILSTRKKSVFTLKTRQKYVRRVDKLGSGMEAFGDWQKVGAPWEAM